MKLLLIKKSTAFIVVFLLSAVMVPGQSGASFHSSSVPDREDLRSLALVFLTELARGLGQSVFSNNGGNSDGMQVSVPPNIPDADVATSPAVRFSEIVLPNGDGFSPLPNSDFIDVNTNSGRTADVSSLILGVRVVDGSTTSSVDESRQGGLCMPMFVPEYALSELSVDDREKYKGKLLCSAIISIIDGVARTRYYDGYTQNRNKCSLASLIPATFACVTKTYAEGRQLNAALRGAWNLNRSSFIDRVATRVPGRGNAGQFTYSDVVSCRFTFSTPLVSGGSNLPGYPSRPSNFTRAGSCSQNVGVGGKILFNSTGYINANVQNNINVEDHVGVPIYNSMGLLGQGVASMGSPGEYVVVSSMVGNVRTVSSCGDPNAVVGVTRDLFIYNDDDGDGEPNACDMGFSGNRGFSGDSPGWVPIFSTIGKVFLGYDTTGDRRPDRDIPENSCASTAGLQGDCDANGVPDLLQYTEEPGTLGCSNTGVAVMGDCLSPDATNKPVVRCMAEISGLNVIYYRLSYCSGDRGAGTVGSYTSPEYQYFRPPASTPGANVPVPFVPFDPANSPGCSEIFLGDVKLWDCNNNGLPDYDDLGALLVGGLRSVIDPKFNQRQVSVAIANIANLGQNAQTVLNQIPQVATNVVNRELIDYCTAKALEIGIEALQASALYLCQRICQREDRVLDYTFCVDPPTGLPGEGGSNIPGMLTIPIDNPISDVLNMILAEFRLNASPQIIDLVCGFYDDDGVADLEQGSITDQIRQAYRLLPSDTPGENGAIISGYVSEQADFDCLQDNENNDVVGAINFIDGLFDSGCYRTDTGFVDSCNIDASKNVSTRLGVAILSSLGFGENGTINIADLNSEFVGPIQPPGTGEEARCSIGDFAVLAANYAYWRDWPLTDVADSTGVVDQDELVGIQADNHFADMRRAVLHGVFSSFSELVDDSIFMRYLIDQMCVIVGPPVDIFFDFPQVRGLTSVPRFYLYKVADVRREGTITHTMHTLADALYWAMFVYGCLILILSLTPGRGGKG